jgi:hypothetical protein
MISARQIFLAALYVTRLHKLTTRKIRLARGVHKDKAQPMNTHKSTTYDLIVQSEDKNRTLIETVIYALFILSAIVSIWQFVMQPIVVPFHTAEFASTQTTTAAACKI